MQEKRQILRECKCFKLHIRNSYKNGIYSEKQIAEKYGRDFLQSLKQTRRLNNERS